MSVSRSLPTSRKPARKLPSSGGHRRGGAVGIVIAVLVFGAIGYLLYRQFGRADKIIGQEMVTSTVVRGPFDHIVLEQGEVESSSNIEVVCEVKSRGSGSGTPILWVIDEGTYVKKGDKLVELDASGLETELKSQRISVSSAEALVISSEATVKTAEIALQEYIQGTYLQERKLIESEIFVANQELFSAELELDSARRLGAKGVVKKLQIESVEFSVENAKNNLEAAQAKLRVLDELTMEKNKVQFESDIEAAKARYQSDLSVLSEERDKLVEIEDQIAKCVMYSPSEGVVVHKNSFSSRGGSEFVVEEGAIVRERQTIINLPDPSKMQVKAKINESRITLISVNMAAKVKVNAVQGDMLARVSRVNKYAEPGGFFSSSVKEYATIIEILDPPPSIRTGMTAEVRIFVEQLDEALQIPVHGLYEYKDHHFCLKKDGEKLETVEITIGATNEKTVTIESGLKEGDTIVLDPRKHLDLMKFPEIATVSDREALAKIGENAGPPTVIIDGPSEGGGGGGFDPSAIVERVFSGADTNSDGTIDSDEKAGLNPQMADNFTKFDANGDGSLTKAELTQGMKSAGPKGGGQRGGGGGGPGGGGGGGGQRGGGGGPGGGRP